MNFLQMIFSLLAFMTSVYSTVCLINIILSWIPAARYTRFGQFISTITDPYLNLFRNIRGMQVGTVNFSPILSIGLLSLLSSLFSQISRTGRFNLSGLLISLLGLLWQVIFGIGLVVLLLALIRLIVLIAKNGVTPYDSPWNHVDAILSPFCYKVTKPLSAISKKVFSYRTALALSVISLAIILTVTYIILRFLSYFCSMIPF